MRISNKYISFMKITLILLLTGLAYPAIGDEDNTSYFETFSGPEWRNCGSGSNWYPDISGDHLNVLRSGPIECTGVSSICRDVNGPANVTFYWKSDVTNKDFGQLSFFVDNIRYMCLSDNWVSMSYLIRDEGHHELKWEFRKIKCYPKNKGAGWIADVNIITHALDRNSHEAKTSASNITMILPNNNTKLKPDIIIVASNLTISPDNITINPSQLTISPTNLASIPDIRVSIIPPNECPIVELISPKDNSIVSVNNQVQFLYMPLDDNALINCTLYIANDNGTIESINSSKIENYDKNLLDYSFPEVGEYRWWINCCDNVECSDSKHTYRNITVIPKTVYVDQKNLMPNGVTNFKSISDAIRNVPDGTTVIVEQGDYYVENGLVIDKSLMLKGNISESNRKPNVLGSGPVILVMSNGVIIEGFNITKINGGGEGIRVGSNNETCYNNITISKNIISTRCITGIYIENCLNCNVFNNSIYNTYEAGIDFIRCIRCNITNNTIYHSFNNTESGTHTCCVHLSDSENISLVNNTFGPSPIGVWCYNSSIINNTDAVKESNAGEQNIINFIYNCNIVNGYIGDEVRLYKWW